MYIYIKLAAIFTAPTLLANKLRRQLDDESTFECESAEEAESIVIELKKLGYDARVDD